MREHRPYRKLFLTICVITTCISSAGVNADDQAFQLVVMDPLAAPLSCPCVEGYAQRRYDELAQYLEDAIGRAVNLTFAESLEKALASENCHGADLVIGKDSVVRADAQSQKYDVIPIAQLTGKDGSATQTGLVVVPSTSKAKHIGDLKGYKILFGPAECDEKYSAPRDLLAAAGIAPPSANETETSAACSDGACKIIEWGNDVQAAAVISSYAAPLLEGCGTIEKGDLRIVGETAPVPFVTAFHAVAQGEQRVPQEQKQIKEALFGVIHHPDLLLALETMLGFVPLSDDYLDYHAKRKEVPSKTSAEPSTRKSAG